MFYKFNFAQIFHSYKIDNIETLKYKTNFFPDKFIYIFAF